MSKSKRNAAPSSAPAEAEAAAPSVATGPSQVAGGNDFEVAQAGFVNEIPIPFLDEMQASFGDLSGIVAYAGPEAAASAKALGTEAYTFGTNIAFSSTSPPKDMVAHELAHAIQQSGGGAAVQAYGGGAGGYENEANDAAASAMVGEQANVAMSGPTGVLKWGGEDHFAIGTLAGQKALGKVPAQNMEEGTDQMRTADGTDITGPGAGTTVKVRTGEGTSISYGAMARFGGDYVKTPGELEGQSHETLLGGSTSSAVDNAAYMAGKNPDKLANFGPMALVASTNMNHFYPLNQNEWRKNHELALKFASEGDEVQAMLHEGHAGHFLMDCFASGHMVPRGYDSLAGLTNADAPTTELALVRALVGDYTGAASDLVEMVTPGIQLAYNGFTKSGDWHDFFCTLENGLPTTKGRFHGDHTMDGGDLDHVSGVASDSLAEVMAALQGKSYSGGVESQLPHPDFGGIMADPVAGPAWRLMMADYKSVAEQAAVDVQEGEEGVSSSGTTFDSKEAVDLMNANVFGMGAEEDTKPKSIADQRNSTKGAVEGIKYYIDVGYGANRNMELNDDLKDITGEERARKYGDVLSLEKTFGLFSGLKETATAYRGAAATTGSSADTGLAKSVIQQTDKWLQDINTLDSNWNMVTGWFGRGLTNDEVRDKIRSDIEGVLPQFATVAATPTVPEESGSGGGGLFGLFG